MSSAAKELELLIPLVK